MNIELDKNILNDPQVFNYALLLNRLRLFNETLKPLNDLIESLLKKDLSINYAIKRRGIDIPVTVEYFRHPVSNRIVLGHATSPLGYEVLTVEEETEIKGAIELEDLLKEVK